MLSQHPSPTSRQRGLASVREGVTTKDPKKEGTCLLSEGLLCAGHALSRLTHFILIKTPQNRYAVTEFYRLREGLPTHLTVHDPVPVPVGRLVRVHLLFGHLGELLSQLPPALRHLDGRGQEHKVLDEPDHQALAVHLQQGLGEEQSVRQRAARVPAESRCRHHLLYLNVLMPVIHP